MRDTIRHTLRVGVLAAVALVVIALTILTVGRQQQLFTSQVTYYTTFRYVSGLQEGAPVQLTGVDVGSVKNIKLPVDPASQSIHVEFTVDARYTERIREDTRASIKSMGLLGDKYLALRGGSPGSPRIAEGGQVEGRDPAEVSEFVASGEDVMENLLAISSSLKVILRRIESGEGLLGAMTMSTGAEADVGRDLDQSIASLRTILQRIESGQGVLGQLVREDDAGPRLVDELSAAAEAIQRVSTTLTADLARDDTAYAALVRDPGAAENVRAALDALAGGAKALEAAAGELASGRGTLPRLMQDEDFADSFLDDLRELADSLRSAAEKLDEGEGSAGALLNDPQLYEDLEHVVRGVKSSKVMSWFIRNRRRAGERLAAEETAADGAGATPSGR